MNVAVDVACRQVAQGHTVAMASAGGSYVRLLAENGVGHFQLRQTWQAPWTLPRSALRLHALIRTWKPDVVHAHMMTGALLGRGVRFGAAWRLVTTVHNEWQPSAVLMGVGDRVIAVSAAVATRMAARRVAPGKIDVVRNGPLNSPRRLPGDGAVASLTHPAILTVAGLYLRKGIADLIAAFGTLAERHPTATLYVVGDGPDRATFEAQARAAGLGGRIHFTGFLADPRPYFRGADIFVLASLSEPFGLVVAEAREMGCAVVASDVGGIPEVLEDGRAGLLVPPGNPAALGRTLAGLLDDPSTLIRWQAAARRGLDWLDVGRVAEETVQVYQRAIDFHRWRGQLPLARRNAAVPHVDASVD
ncbi:glycosyltransferase family 4 protein [Methylobacterium sp.]|uniref:glycosyltransferase family 4 protein n=1 Tax=Methylobacterium sp. TaxID=409 RepID=UPI002637FCE6|nr:glycosyltransferase family 4 protein [Methylobacterium sp.]